MRRPSLRAGSGWCSSSSSSSGSSGSGIATNNPGRNKSWRGRSWVPFVPPLTHSRKLYRSATAAATTVPATPPSASASLGFFHHSSNSFTFTPPTLPSTCSSTLSPTTKLSSRPRLQQITSRRPFFANSPKHLFYSTHATPSKVPLPIMYEGKWTATTVRQTFFDYFAERGHTIGTIQTQLAPYHLHRSCLPLISTQIQLPRHQRHKLIS